MLDDKCDLFLRLAKACDIIEICERYIKLTRGTAQLFGNNIKDNWENFIRCYCNDEMLIDLELNKYSQLVIYLLARIGQLDALTALAVNYNYLLMNLFDALPEDDVFFDRDILLPFVKDIIESRAYQHNDVYLCFYIKFVIRDLGQNADIATLQEIIQRCYKNELACMVSPDLFKDYLAHSDSTALLLAKYYWGLKLFEAAAKAKIDIGVNMDKTLLVWLHTQLALNGHSQSSFHLFRYYALPKRSSHVQAAYYCKLSLLQGNLAAGCKEYLDKINKEYCFAEANQWLQRRLALLKGLFKPHYDAPKQ